MTRIIMKMMIMIMIKMMSQNTIIKECTSITRQNHVYF
jgi:hypothetical protein